MDKEIIVHEAHEVQGFNETPDNVQLLKTTLTSAGTVLTDPELQLFLYQVKRTALDPLARQIYVMKNSGKISFITSIDGYRLVAERSGKYLGQTKTEWAFDDDGNLLSATVGVIKKLGDDKDTTYATAWFDEYAKDLDKYWSMWKKMPKTMIAKVAESLALRKAFPQELGGVYTEDEMPMERPAQEYNRDVHQEEPARDVNDDIAEEMISSDALLKISGEIKKHGISAALKVNKILDILAKEKGGANAEALSVQQGRELFAQIRDSNKEELLSLLEAE